MKFSTNNFKMSLCILFGILNSGKTFRFGLYFITSEFTATFIIIKGMLDKLFFNNCSQPWIVCRDFTKGLAFIISLWEAQKEEIKMKKVDISWIYMNDIV